MDKLYQLKTIYKSSRITIVISFKSISQIALEKTNLQ